MIYKLNFNFESSMPREGTDSKLYASLPLASSLLLYYRPCSVETVSLPAAAFTTFHLKCFLFTVFSFFMILIIFCCCYLWACFQVFSKKVVVGYRKLARFNVNSGISFCLSRLKRRTFKRMQSVHVLELGKRVFFLIFSQSLQDYPHSNPSQFAWIKIEFSHQSLNLIQVPLIYFSLF